MPSFRSAAFPSFLVLAATLLTAQVPSDKPAATVENITLSDAIKRALGKNYTIQTSTFDVSIANASVSEQLGIFDPQFVGSYNYIDSETPVLSDPVTGMRPPPTVDKNTNYSLGLNSLMPWGLSVSLNANSVNDREPLTTIDNNFATFAGVSGRQPLLRNFGFDATTAQIRIAKTNRSISEWQFRQIIIDTITQVIFAYCDLNFANAQLRSALQSRERAAQLVDENEKRYKVGAMSEYDVVSARARLASLDDGILQSQEFVHEAENNLKALITDDRSAQLLNWNISITNLQVPPLPVVDAEADFRDALKKRPDYMQAQLAVTRSDIDSRFQRNQLLPRLDLVGSYGYNGYDSSFNTSSHLISNQDYRAFSYGAQVSIPITFTTERARYRAAKLQLRKSQTSLASLEQNIVVQIGNAAARIDSAHQRVEATRNARELGEKTLDAEVKRLRAGTGSTFFVVQQQEILSQLQIVEASAINDYHKALADYDRQLGATLDKLNISITVPK
jgi:outer membrane protein